METIELQSFIERAQRGEQSAFFHIYQQFKGKVFAICYRLLSDRQQAEDASQEAFVRVWQQLPLFRGDSLFSTWLHTIATRTAVDYWRKLKMARLCDDDSELELWASEPPQLEQRDLETLIGRLPLQARAVFVLFALEGHSHQEIADLLGIAEGSSKAQYHRARQLLRSWLDDN